MDSFSAPLLLSCGIDSVGRIFEPAHGTDVEASMPTASLVLVLGYVLLSLAVAILCVWAYAAAGVAVGETPSQRAGRSLRASGVLGAWLAASMLLASTGVLARFDLRPAPLFVLIATTIVVTVLLATSSVGRRLANGLPAAFLVGIQAFRLPLELLMHQTAREGVMPMQMSFSGYNFDVVSGTLAVVVAALLAIRGGPRWLLVSWNVLGAALLVVVVVLAALSTPVIHAFGQSAERLNTFVAFPPFVWLPTFLVPVAVAGHIIIARHLRLTSVARSPESRGVVIKPN